MRLSDELFILQKKEYQQYILKKIPLLIIFIFYLIGTVSAETSALNRETGSKSNCKFVFYYFHGNFRCRSCIQAEKLTRKAVKKIQSENPELMLEIRVINKDLPENSDFVKQYKVESPSVIIAEFRDSKLTRWKDCVDIWDYYTDEKDYIEYMRNELHVYLN